MNTLPKSCNYYEKYMKYKKKYIDYKNNLLALSREKSALIGGGIDAQIEILNTYTPTRFVVKYTDAHEKQEKSVIYKTIEKAGSGSIGTVYKIEQIEPLLPPGSNNSFAIKLTILKVGDDVFNAEIKREKEAENKEEGKVIDSLQVEERVKAIYQGRTGNIDFAIYNYLGENLETFLKKDDITGETLLSLIQQLHNQLYRLNKSSSFHNDVKIENIVVCSTVAPSGYELSLIDYGLYTPSISQRGTYQSMCIHGCARFLLGSKPPLATDLQKLVRDLLLKATSTDYVGFFNFIICMLQPSFCAVNIYIAILEIKVGYTIDTLLKILCLLCYVSNSADPVCTQFLEHPSCISIVQKINDKLETYIDPKELFKNFVPGGDIPVHLQRRILFLSYLYFNITTHFKRRYATFIHITKLPKLLWDISCCLDLQFNLEQFNANFGTIFNDQLLVPLPPPAPSPQPSAPSPLLPPTISPSPSPSQQQQTPPSQQQQTPPSPQLPSQQLPASITAEDWEKHQQFMKGVWARS